MATYLVTWEETRLRGTYVEAASEAEALAEGESKVAHGEEGHEIEWVSDDKFEARESGR